jgi:hypothetical protein
MKIINTVNDYCSKLEKKERDIAKKVLKCFIELLVDFLITTGEPVTLYNRLGTFRLFKYNTQKVEKVHNNKILDYKLMSKFKKEGLNKQIKILNTSTMGYWWKFKWYKTNSKIFLGSKELWSCDLVRSVRRSTSYGDRKRHLCVTDFFRDKGWQLYTELPAYKIYLHKL